MQQLPPDLIRFIASQGQNGDTEIGHFTKGDIVIPAEAPDTLKHSALQGMAAAGLDPSRYTAGSAANDINQNTGMMAFDEGSDGPNGANGDGNGTGGGTGGAVGGADGTGSSTGTTGEGGTAAGVGASVSGGAHGVAVGGSDAAGGSNASSPGAVVGGDHADSGNAVGSAGQFDGEPNPVGGWGFDPGGALKGFVTGGGSLIGAAGGGITFDGRSVADHASEMAHDALAGLGGGTPAPEGHDFAGRDGASVQDVLNGQNLNGQPSTSGGATGSGGLNPNNQNSITQGNVGPGITGDLTDLNQAIQSIQGLGKVSPFGPNYGSDIIKGILDNQHGLADQALHNAFQRGTLSDLGLNSAESQLGNQDAAAGSRVNTLAGGLIGNYQQQLNQALQGDLTTAQGTSASNPYPIGDVTQQFNDLVAKLGGGFRGDLINQLPTSGLYDIPSLIAAGGNSQGLYNPGGAQASPIMAALSNQRGLGTTGEF